MTDSRKQIQHVIGPPSRQVEKLRKRRQISEPWESIHESRDSLFHTGTGFENYRGLLNLALLLLFLSNTRVALDNLIRYGILVSPLSWASVFLEDPYSWPSTMLVLCVVFFILFPFHLELLLAKGKVSESVGTYLQRLNLVVLLVFPAFVVWKVEPNPFGSFVALAIYTTVFIKMWSYCDVNRWCRIKLRKKHKVSGKDEQETSNEPVDKKDKPLIQYPNNLTYGDIFYFLAAPTLCYDLNFPRTNRIRKRFLIKRSAEVIVLAQVILALGQQWLVPSIVNSMTRFQDMSYSRWAERILKLAIPNHLIWLMGFYWFFHSFLNVTGELLQFGDRYFYGDWWNAGTLERFWSTWNIPVHKFARRHIYQPLVDAGQSKMTAQMFVFAISAFFHEYLVSIPLRMFRLWAFMGMAMQVPVGLFCNHVLRGGNSGNIIVWLSLILGQPFAILMYVHDYIITHGTLSTFGLIPENMTANGTTVV